MLHRLLCLLLWLGAAAPCAGEDIAAAYNPDVGHTGSALERDPAAQGFRVTYVAFGSPADIAGIRKGDLVTAIGGESTRDMTLAEARSVFNGPIGGTVTATVAHPGAAALDITITRRSLLDTYGPAALSGDARAQTIIGFYYEHAPGDTRDLAKAVDYYRKAAAQDEPHALVSLAYLYQNGMGVEPDAVQAVALYRKAAAHDDAAAETQLGIACFLGRGVGQSDSDAFTWFTAAAAHGDPLAESYLGYLYHTGRGVARDDHAAFTWYLRAAQQHDTYAAARVSEMYGRGEGVPADAAESLRWAKIAGTAGSARPELKGRLALLSLDAFFKSPGPPVLDLSPLQGPFRIGFLVAYALLGIVYLVLGALVGFLPLYVPAARGRTLTALGWLAFYFTAQIMAILALVALLDTLHADVALLAMVLAGGAPVVACAFAPDAAPFWRPSTPSLPRLIGYGAACLVILFAGESAYDFLYFKLTGSAVTPQDTGAFFLKARHASPWIAASCLALFMPVIEEILFRGYLHDALARHLPTPAVIILGAAVFALYHLEFTVFPQLFGMGLLFGWARHKSGSIRLPIVLHMANNAVFLLVAS